MKSIFTYIVVSIFLLSSFVLESRAHVDIKQADGTFIIHGNRSDLMRANARMGFTMALPHSAKPKITVDIHRWSEFKGDTCHVSFIPTIQQQSVFRGIEVSDFTFHPIKKSKGDSWLIADSFSIKIVSPELIATDYQIPHAEYGLLAHIINPNHIPLSRISRKKTESVLSDHWYSAKQDYVKLITKQDGIAHVKMRDILSKQQQWKGESSAQLELLFKGASYPIGVIDQDGKVDDDDVIIFAARRAEGDTTWRNYVTDEATFFLTLNDAPNAKNRLSAFPPILPILADTAVSVSIHHEKDSEFYAGDVISPIDYRYLTSDFSTGKNFFWDKISTVRNFRTFIDTIHVSQSITPMNLRIALHGANDRPSIEFEHRYDIFWNDALIKRDSFGGFADHYTDCEIPSSQINHGPNILRIESIPVSDTLVTECFIDHVITSSISPLRLLHGSLSFEDSLARAVSMTFTDLRSASFIAIDTARNFFTLENANPSGNQFIANLSVLPGIFKGIFADSLAWIIPEIRTVPKSRLRDSSRQADVLLISHPAFLQASERLAQHRRTQGYSVSVISSDDIYKEFGHGSKDAHAIKDFIRHTHRFWQFPVPSYIVFMGDASWDPLKLTFKAHQEDFIPSFGFPVSDIWFTTPSNDSIDPELILGRLSVSSAVQAEKVVDKLIQYDTISASPWMKNFLFLSGGDADDPFFHNQFDGIAPFILDPPISGDTVRIRRMNKVGGVDESIATQIRSAVNNGSLWVNFAGHGSPEYFELDGWRAQDLNNPARYFLLTTFSCNSGAFAEPTTVCRNESYVLEGGKGAIASAGNTYTGITSPDYFNFVSMYTALSKYGIRRIGDLVFATKIGQGTTTDPFYRNAMMQFCLIGDPLTKLAIAPDPDYYIRSEDITTELVTAIDENFTIKGTIRNRGTMDTMPVLIQCIRSVSDRKDTLSLEFPAFAREKEFNFTFPTLNQSGIHGIEIRIDPLKSIIDEQIVSNNSITFQMNVYAASLTVIDPLPGWNVQGDTPRFRFLLPLRNREFTSYDLRIEKPDGSVIAGFSGTASSQLTFGELHVDWTPNIQLTPGGNAQDYMLFTRTFDARTIQYSPWEVTPFHALPREITDTAIIHIEQLASIPESKSKNLVSGANTKSLSLDGNTVNLLIESCNGGEDYRYGYLKFGNRTFIERVNGSKWNLLHLKPFDSIGIYRDFDAFYGAQEERYRAGNVGDLIRYLRDSVEQGDHIAISVSDGSFRGAIVTPKGMMGDEESLIQVLKEFGSTKIDSVFKGLSYPDGSLINSDDRYRISFAMFGMKGGLPGSAKEAFGSFRDTLSVNVEHIIAFNEGTYFTGPIGPAIEWHELMMQDSLRDQGDIYYILHGLNGEKKRVITLDSSKTGSFSLGNINAMDYPYVEIEARVQRSSRNSGPHILALNGMYRPAAELAVLPTSFTVKGLEQRSGLPIRGDSMVCSLDIYNLSLRQASIADMPLCIIQQPIGGGGNTESTIAQIPSIPKNSPISYESRASTFELANVSEWTARINCDQSKAELFSFNNTATQVLIIGEDKESPTIEILADGKVLREYDVVALNPRITIRISDNSFLPIDTTKTFIRNNPFALRSDPKIRDYSFVRGTYGSAMRAEFSYIPQDRFEVGENIIYVITEDASANKDTVRRTVLVVLNSSLDELNTYPNPAFSGSDISFDMNYLSQITEATYSLTIADIRGAIQHRMSGEISIGKNTLKWNGRNDQGVSMPPGVYVYRIDVNGDTFIAPSFGKIIITE
ncbi:MAG: C25 family cysteine peptidase [Ignavibacteria bacterium]